MSLPVSREFFAWLKTVDEGVKERDDNYFKRAAAVFIQNEVAPQSNDVQLAFACLVRLKITLILWAPSRHVSTSVPVRTRTPYSLPCLAPTLQ